MCDLLLMALVLVCYVCVCLYEFGAAYMQAVTKFSTMEKLDMMASSYLLKPLTLTTGRMQNSALSYIIYMVPMV